MPGRKKTNAALVLALCLCLVFSALPPMQSKAEIITKYRWHGFIYNKTNRIVIENYTGNAETLRIPVKIKGEEVHGVLRLSKAKRLKKLIVPDGIQFYHAVASCKTLKKIQISKTNSRYKMKNSLLLNKKGNILRGCPGGIKNPKMPNSVTIVGYFAFRDSDIEEVKLGKNVRYISNYAFTGCKKLKKIKWNKNIRRIGSCAFKNCRSLTEIAIPKSVRRIGHYVFDGCTNLKKVMVGPNVKKIEEWAFPEQATIYGKKGSAVEKYAKRYKLKFVPV